MPNWCSNNVFIDGERESVQRFVEYVALGDSPFSLQAILPMPDDLTIAMHPVRIVTQVEYDEYEPQHDDGRPITQEMSDRFTRLYGYDNWHDWRVANWGTKWDTDGREVRSWITPRIRQLARAKARFDFNTAWGPPVGIYRALVKKFPKLHIEWPYVHEGNQSLGNLAIDELQRKPPVETGMTSIDALEIVLKIAVDSIQGTPSQSYDSLHEHMEQVCGSWEHGARAIDLIDRLHKSMKGDRSE